MLLEATLTRCHLFYRPRFWHMFKNAISPAKLTFRRSIITDSAEMDCLLWLGCDAYGLRTSTQR